MSDTAARPARSSGRNVLLIVSLCLNVALIAMIVVAAFGIIRMSGRPKGMLAPHALLMNASDAERPKIQAVIDAHAAKVKELEKADFQARKAALEIFAEPKFDPVAFRKALDAVTAADDAFHQEQTEVTEQVAPLLAPSERRAVTERAHRRMRWWHGFHGHFPK